MAKCQRHRPIASCTQFFRRWGQVELRLAARRGYRRIVVRRSGCMQPAARTEKWEQQPDAAERALTSLCLSCWADEEWRDGAGAWAEGVWSAVCASGRDGSGGDRRMSRWSRGGKSKDEPGATRKITIQDRGLCVNNRMAINSEALVSDLQWILTCEY